MQKQLVRPRYLPGVEVQSVAALVDPLYEAPLNCRQNFIYKAFCLAAAPWGTCGVEAIFPSVAVPRLCGSPPFAAASSSFCKSGASVIHGVFTWSLVTALIETLREPQMRAGAGGGGVAQGSGGLAVVAAATPGVPIRLVTYKRLLDRTRRVVSDLKWNRLFKLDQHPDLTIHTGGGGHVTDIFCSLEQQQQQSRAASRRETGACVAGAAAASSSSWASTEQPQQQQQSVGGAAAAAAAGHAAAAAAAAAPVNSTATTTRDLQQQQATGRAYPFISAERAWQQVTEAALEEAAVRQHALHMKLPYRAADCYRRAFPTPPAAASAFAAAAFAAAGAAPQQQTAAAAGRVAVARSPTPAAAAAAARGRLLTQLPKVNAENAAAYIAMLQQQQQQGLPVADTAQQLLEQLKQQERELQEQLQQLQHQQQQRALQQQQRRLREQQLQQQQQLQHQQQQRRLQQQQRLQWQQQQQRRLESQLQQQKQCVIARLPPPAGEQLLWKDFSTVVYV